MSSTEDKRLIEEWLPLIEIDKEARSEKSGWARPKTFELLFWWARKPLITCRAAILGSLLPANFDRQSFRRELGLGRRRRAYFYKPSHRLITQNKGLRLLDPFAGGGSISFEAACCGVESVSLEYNPVAYVILKGTLEYPKIIQTT